MPHPSAAASSFATSGVDKGSLARLGKQLQDAHVELLERIDVLAAVTESDAPGPLALERARFQLSSASLRRRLIANDARQMLMGAASPDVRKTVQSLKELDAKLRDSSAAHVRQWTVEAIRSDWAGYRQASQEMTRLLRDSVKCEQVLLLPLLCRRS